MKGPGVRGCRGLWVLCQPGIRSSIGLLLCRPAGCSCGRRERDGDEKGISFSPPRRGVREGEVGGGRGGGGGEVVLGTGGGGRVVGGGCGRGTVRFCP